MSLWWGQRSGWRCHHSRFLLPVWTSWHVSFTNTHFLSLQDPLPVPPGHRRLLGCQSGAQKHHIGEPARRGVCRNTNTQKSQHVVTSCLQRRDLHPTLQNKGNCQSSGTKCRVNICLQESSLVSYLVSGGKTVWLDRGADLHTTPELFPPFKVSSVRSSSTSVFSHFSFFFDLNSIAPFRYLRIVYRVKMPLPVLAPRWRMHFLCAVNRAFFCSVGLTGNVILSQHSVRPK